MESIINNIKVAIITVPETFNFDLPIKVENTLKHKNQKIIMSKNTMAFQLKLQKMRLLNYCSNISIEMKFMKVENSKTNEVHDWKKKETTVQD